MVAGKLNYGDLVAFQWGTAEVQGTVRELYGRKDDRRVVLTLTPEITGYVVDEPTTLALSVDDVHLVDEATVDDLTRWDDIKEQRPGTDGETRAAVERDLALGQLIYDLRTEAGLTQRELAERIGTTRLVISRLEEGGGVRNCIDTLAKVATALDRHLVVSFPEKVPARLNDAVQIA